MSAGLGLRSWFLLGRVDLGRPSAAAPWGFSAGAGAGCLGAVEDAAGAGLGAVVLAGGVGAGAGAGLGAGTGCSAVGPGLKGCGACFLGSSGTSFALPIFPR